MFENLKNGFKKLVDDIKSFEDDMVASNNDENKKITKCKNCGANLNGNKCDFCGSTYNNDTKVGLFNLGSDDEQNVKSSNKRYPVLIYFEDGQGFSAYDHFTDTDTAYFATVKEAMDKIKEKLEKVAKNTALEDGEMLYVPTEADLLNVKAIKKTLDKGEAKIKFVDVDIAQPINPNDDPNW